MAGWSTWPDDHETLHRGRGGEDRLVGTPLLSDDPENAKTEVWLRFGLNTLTTDDRLKATEPRVWSRVQVEYINDHDIAAVLQPRHETEPPNTGQLDGTCSTVSNAQLGCCPIGKVEFDQDISRGCHGLRQGRRCCE
jgi:hypothetical protein